MTTTQLSRSPSTPQSHPNTGQRHQWLIGCMAICFSILFALNAQAGDRLVQVSATGEASASPDYLTLRVQLEETQSTLPKAKREIDKSFDQLLKAIRSAGIKEKDVEAAHIQNHPQYRWNDGKRQYEGERVIRNVSIKLKDLNNYGELVHEIMQIESAQVQNTQFGFNDPQALYDEALTNALKMAQRKAKLMVTTLGASLGPVVNINETGRINGPQPMQTRVMMLESAKAADPAPMLVQDETVRVDIHVTFNIE